MPRTFNETVPTITDVFEYAEIKCATYKFFEEASECIYTYIDKTDGIFLMKKEAFLAILHNLLFNTDNFNNNAQDLWNKINQFIDNSKSQFVVYE